MELVDTHVHLDDAAFDADRDAVVARAVAAGVTTMVAIGTNVDSSQAAVALAERFPAVRAALGIHPHEAGTTPPERVRDLTQWVRHPRVVALGETGLDYYRAFAPRDAQAALFRVHLTVAQERGLPVIIHCRDAYPDVLTILQEFPTVTCVFHAFSGSLETAQECVRRGHYLAFGGPITFRHAYHAVEGAREAPDENILLETDAPYLSPHPHRGRRNEPAQVRLIAERLADIRSLSLDAVAALTTANARRAFSLDKVGAPA